MGVSVNNAMKYHRWLGLASVFFISIHSLLWFIVWAKNGLFYDNAIKYVGYYECQWGNGNPTILAGVIVRGLKVPRNIRGAY